MTWRRGNESVVLYYSETKKFLVFMDFLMLGCATDCRLLDPDLESSGSLFVGCYILQLILHLPSQMLPHIRDLAAALIRRMQSVQIAGLKSSLIVIFARLVCYVQHFIIYIYNF